MTTHVMVAGYKVEFPDAIDHPEGIGKAVVSTEDNFTIKLPRLEEGVMIVMEIAFPEGTEEDPDTEIISLSHGRALETTFLGVEDNAQEDSRLRKRYVKKNERNRDGTREIILKRKPESIEFHVLRRSSTQVLKVE